MTQPHRVAAPIPAVEIADDGNAARVRRPNGKTHAWHAIHHHRVRAEALAEIAVLPLAEEVYVEFAQKRAERIGILGLLYRPAPVDAQEIRPRPGARADEEAGVAHKAQCRLQAPFIPPDR